MNNTINRQTEKNNRYSWFDQILTDKSFLKQKERDMFFTEIRCNSDHYIE